MRKWIVGPGFAEEYDLHGTSGRDVILPRAATSVHDGAGNDKVFGADNTAQTFYLSSGRDVIHFGVGDYLFTRSPDQDRDKYIFHAPGRGGRDPGAVDESARIMMFDIARDELSIRGYTTRDLAGPVDWTLTRNDGPPGDFFSDWFWSATMKFKDGTHLLVEGGTLGETPPDPTDLAVKIPGPSDLFWYA